MSFCRNRAVGHGASAEALDDLGGRLNLVERHCIATEVEVQQPAERRAADHAVDRVRRRALEQLLELADVAGEVAALQVLESRGREPNARASDRLADPLDEDLRELGDVLRTGPQRRDLDVKAEQQAAEPGVEVAASNPRGERIGRARQHARALAKRAPLGAREPSRPVHLRLVRERLDPLEMHGAGARAPYRDARWLERIARRRIARRVDVYKLAGRCGTQLVERRNHRRTPAARLSRHEHGRAQRREPRDLPADAGDGIAAPGDPPAEVERRSRRVVAARGVAHQTDEVLDIDVERAHEVIGAGLEGERSGLDRAMTRKDDHRDVGARADAAQQLETIAAGHPHVGDDDVRWSAAEAGPALLAVLRLDHPEPRLVELGP